MLLASAVMISEDKTSRAVAPPAELLPLGMVGFAGHRELRDPVRIKAAIRQVLQELKPEGDGLILTFSSIASGADALFADVCLALKLPWKAILPFPKAFYLQSVSEEERRVASR